MNELLRYLIICPLVGIAGFIDAIAGGGGLISLPAYMISGLPPHTAVATNKMSSTMGTSVATYNYAKMGYIPWKEAAGCIVSALLGSTIGANLALKVSTTAFTIAMLVALPLTAVYVLKGRSVDTDREPYSFSKTVLIGMAVALVVGIYDGFYGPGTGTYLILLLTGLAHHNLKEANGICKAINLSSNIAALTVYLVHGRVLLPLGLCAGCFGILGNYLGSKCFVKGGAKFVKPVIIIVLIIFFIKIMLELLGVTF